MKKSVDLPSRLTRIGLSKNVPRFKNFMILSRIRTDSARKKF